MHDLDLDISWIKEQEKLQQINENYFKEPMENIELFFIYINSNDYIEKINCQSYVFNEKNNHDKKNENNVISNDEIIHWIEKNKYMCNHKYKIQEILLFNVSLNPENIQSYSKNENLLESSSKFLQRISIVNDIIIPPSIFIFHKVNALFFIFKNLNEVTVPKSILKSSVDVSCVEVVHKNTKKVRIVDKVNKIKSSQRHTRKQKK